MLQSGDGNRVQSSEFKELIKFGDSPNAFQPLGRLAGAPLTAAEGFGRLAGTPRTRFKALDGLRGLTEHGLRLKTACGD